MSQARDGILVVSCRGPRVGLDPDRSLPTYSMTLWFCDSMNSNPIVF